MTAKFFDEIVWLATLSAATELALDLQALVAWTGADFLLQFACVWASAVV